MYSQISGTGHCLPERVVTNFDLEKIMDTTDEWIRTRTGIERRHFQRWVDHFLDTLSEFDLTQTEIGEIIDRVVVDVDAITGESMMDG